MSAYFNCPEHGQFSILAAFPDRIDKSNVCRWVTHTKEAPCPVCGRICPGCKPGTAPSKSCKGN